MQFKEFGEVLHLLSGSHFQEAKCLQGLVTQSPLSCVQSWDPNACVAASKKGIKFSSKSNWRIFVISFSSFYNRSLAHSVHSDVSFRFALRCSPRSWSWDIFACIAASKGEIELSVILIYFKKRSCIKQSQNLIASFPWFFWAFWCTESSCSLCQTGDNLKCMNSPR